MPTALQKSPMTTDEPINPAISASVCRAADRLLVVIVNFHTAELTIDALRSLAPHLEPARDAVVVVDNDSGDDSVQRISQTIEQEQLSDVASVIPAGCNGGFAFGNNVGAKLAFADDPHPKYILLLNPDTLVHDGAIQHMRSFMDTHPQAGILGCKIEDPDSVEQTAAFRAPSPLSEMDYGFRSGPISRALSRWSVSLAPAQNAIQCDWVSGACMMIRCDVISKIGPLDEGYFLYYEELDYCLRARDAGWEIWHTPAATITHFEGAATDIHAARKRRPRWWYDSRRRFFVKRYGTLGLLTADALWAIGRSFLHLRRLLHLGGDVSCDPAHLSRDLLGGDLRAVLSGETRRIKLQAVKK